MGKTARDRRPNLRPPTRIEVSEGNTKRRVILLILCIVIALSAFTYGVVQYFKGRERSGFTEITASGQSESSVASEFSFFYQLGEKNGEALYRTLAALWSRETVKAHHYFDAEQTYEGVGNLASLSASVGEIVTLEPALYKALEAISASGTRVHYLAPIEMHYRSVFYSSSDAEASDYDMTKNPTLKEYYGKLAAFASDPDAISIELLGENRARLNLSSEYLAFASENEITTFVSLGFMKNAFVADYLASALLDAGFTEGTLTSNDGFTRCLDLAPESSYTYNLFARGDDGIDLAARLKVSGIGAIVKLSAYPFSEKDLDRIYLFADGSTLTSYLDPESGASCAAADILVLYGGESCASLLLGALDAWLTDSLDASALPSLPGEAIWCEDHEIRCTDPAAPISDLAENYRKVNLQ